MADIAILGAGLAGILLAHAIRKRGGTCVLYSLDAPNAASPMAPGIINPLAGRKYKANPVLENHYSEILASFDELEKSLGLKLWHPVSLIRLVEKPEQRQFLSRSENTWQGPLQPSGTHGGDFHDPYGSFETKGAGWLDVPKITTAARNSADFTFVSSDIPKSAFKTIVDCRGWRSSVDPRWQHLPWKCARGEVATVNFTSKSPDRRIWNGGGWLQPLEDGSWRTGATYGWDQFEAPPQPDALPELSKKLSRWLHLPFELSNPKVGIRPIVQDFQPLLGSLPTNPNHYIFSALGSHGAIFGPPCADALAEHILNQRPLPYKWNVQRFS